MYSHEDRFWATHMKHRHELDTERLKHVELMWLAAPSPAEASIYTVISSVDVLAQSNEQVTPFESESVQPPRD